MFSVCPPLGEGVPQSLVLGSFWGGYPLVLSLVLSSPVPGPAWDEGGTAVRTRPGYLPDRTGVPLDRTGGIHPDRRGIPPWTGQKIPPPDRRASDTTPQAVHLLRSCRRTVLSSIISKLALNTFSERQC